MKKSIANVLDKGLEGLQQGKMVETCIALGGDAGEEVAPLLYTAEYLSQTVKAEPSEEFRRSARGRLMARLQQTQPLPAPRHGPHPHKTSARRQTATLATTTGAIFA